MGNGGGFRGEAFSSVGYSFARRREIVVKSCIYGDVECSRSATRAWAFAQAGRMLAPPVASGSHLFRALKFHKTLIEINYLF